MTYLDGTCARSIFVKETKSQVHIFVRLHSCKDKLVYFFLHKWHLNDKLR